MGCLHYIMNFSSGASLFNIMKNSANLDLHCIEKGIDF